MEIFIDRKQLYEVIKSFYTITGVKVTIFDTNHLVIAEYPEDHCSFCSYLNMIKSVKQKCENSNWKAFEECNKTRNIYIYTCHAGLIEIAVPLINNSRILGYVLFGQITNTRNIETIKAKLSKLSSTLSIEKALNLFTEVKYLTSEKIHANAKILEILSMYFISGGMVSTKNELIILKATDWINKNLSLKIDILDLCEFLKISRTQLYNLFRSEKNMGVMEYIRLARLELSKKYLESGQYSIKQIAYLTGFNDSNYFVKTFKKELGITPKKYQKQIMLSI